MAIDVISRCSRTNGVVYTCDLNLITYFGNSHDKRAQFSHAKLDYLLIITIPLKIRV